LTVQSQQEVMYKNTTIFALIIIACIWISWGHYWL